VTAKDPLSPCSRSKTGIVLVAIPPLNGHLNPFQVNLLQIIMHFYSIYLARGASIMDKQAKRFSVSAVAGPASKEASSMS
jgi:hypothetical protein